MASPQPILPDDRLLVELLSKKLALLIVDTLDLSVSGCRFGIPRPQDFLAKRRPQLDALAVTLGSVTVPPNSSAELVAALGASSERLRGLTSQLCADIMALTDWEKDGSIVQQVMDHLSRDAHLLFESMNNHLRLVGSHVTVDSDKVICTAIVRSLPAEFSKEKVPAPLNA